MCVVRNGRLETLERRSSRPNFTACPSGENRSKHEVSRIPRIQAANYKCSANKVNVFIEGTRSTSFLFSLLLPLSTSRLAVTVPRVLLRCSPLVSKRPRRDSPSLHFRFRYPPNTTIISSSISLSDYEKNTRQEFLFQFLFQSNGIFSFQCFFPISQLRGNVRCSIRWVNILVKMDTRIVHCVVSIETSCQFIARYTNDRTGGEIFKRGFLSIFSFFRGIICKPRLISFAVSMIFVE